nr:UPF0158 family protein [uncultured Anaeromusa sp.]
MTRGSVSVFLDDIIVALLAPANTDYCQYLDLASGRVLVLGAKGKPQTATRGLCEESWSLVEQEPERFVPLSPLASQQVTPWYGEFAHSCCQGVQQQELLQLLEGGGFLARFYDALDCDDSLREKWRQFETEKVRSYFLTLVPSQMAVEICNFIAQKEESGNAFG